MPATATIVSLKLVRPYIREKKVKPFRFCYGSTPSSPLGQLKVKLHHSSWQYVTLFCADSLQPFKAPLARVPSIDAPSLKRCKAPDGKILYRIAAPASDAFANTFRNIPDDHKNLKILRWTMTLAHPPLLPKHFLPLRSRVLTFCRVR